MDAASGRVCAVLRAVTEHTAAWENSRDTDTDGQGSKAIRTVAGTVTRTLDSGPDSGTDSGGGRMTANGERMRDEARRRQRMNGPRLRQQW